MNWVKGWFLAVLACLWLGGCSSLPGKSGGQEGDIPAGAEAEFAQAVAALRNGDRETARAGFERLAQAWPTLTGPRANLAIIAYEDGDADQAVAGFEAVLEQDPSHRVALNYLGILARERGDFELAEQYYRRALESAPDDPAVLLNLAFLLDIYLGRPGDALPLYERYREVAPEPDPRIDDWLFDVRNRL